jgi:hypothetical protein
MEDFTLIKSDEASKLISAGAGSPNLPVAARSLALRAIGFPQGSWASTGSEPARLWNGQTAACSPQRALRRVFTWLMWLNKIPRSESRSYHRMIAPL